MITIATGFEPWHVIALIIISLVGTACSGRLIIRKGGDTMELDVKADRQTTDTNTSASTADASNEQEPPHVP